MGRPAGWLLGCTFGARAPRRRESLMPIGVQWKTGTVQRYVDQEIRLMILLFLIPPILIVLTTSTIGRADIEWSLAALPIGWGLQAVIPAYTITKVAPDHVVIRTLVRRIHVTPESIVSIKGIYEGQWRAHISVRTRRHVFIEVRVWKFTDQDQLARTLLAIAGEAGPGVARPSAVRILQQAVSGE